jgi:hypothetical protein
MAPTQHQIQNQKVSRAAANVGTAHDLPAAENEQAGKC